MNSDFLSLIHEYLSLTRDVSHHKAVALNAGIVSGNTLPADEIEINDLYLSLARAKLKVVLRKLSSNDTTAKFLADLEEIKNL